MSQLKPERYPVTEEMREAYTVDADFHFEPSVEKLLPYVEDPNAVRTLELEGFPPTTRYWASAYATPHGGNGRQTHGVAETGEDVVDVMDTLALDMALVTPGYNTLPDVQNVVLKNELVRAYNDYLLEEVAPTDENIKVLAATPQWDPERAVEEIHRHGDNDDVAGFYGFFGHYKLLGQPQYDQMFEALLEYDLSYSMHAGGTGNWPQKDLIGNSIRTFAEMYGLVHPCRAMMMVGNMIITGVFDKYPDLHVTMIEGGLNWVPFFKMRLDEIYQDHPEDIRLTERMAEMGQNYLKKQPSEYIEDNFSFTSQPISIPKKPKNFEAMLDMTDARDSLMFATDYPHYTLELSNWIFESSVIDDEMAENILHKNAERIFRI